MVKLLNLILLSCPENYNMLSSHPRQQFKHERLNFCRVFLPGIHEILQRCALSCEECFLKLVSCVSVLNIWAIMMYLFTQKTTILAVLKSIARRVYRGGWVGVGCMCSFFENRSLVDSQGKMGIRKCLRPVDLISFDHPTHVPLLSHSQSPAFLF